MTHPLDKKRILLVADVHSSPQRLEAATRGIQRSDMRGFLGDAVGYGSRPNEVLSELKGYDFLVAGNHDLAIQGKTEGYTLVDRARIAIEDNKRKIDERSLAVLARMKPSVEIEDILFFHGMPDNPFDIIPDDITDLMNGYRSFSILVGAHTHVPRLVCLNRDSGSVAEERIECPLSIHYLQLTKNRYVIVMPAVAYGRGGFRSAGCCDLRFMGDDAVVTFYSHDWI